MKTMYVVQPGRHRAPHKFSWLQIQHCPQYGPLFFAARIQRRDFEMKLMVNQLLFGTRNDTDVVLSHVRIARYKEFVIAGRQTVREASGDETLVARTLRIGWRQARRHIP